MKEIIFSQLEIGDTVIFYPFRSQDKSQIETLCCIEITSAQNWHAYCFMSGRRLVRMKTDLVTLLIGVNPKIEHENSR